MLGKYFPTIKPSEEWNGLSQKVACFTSLEVFKQKLNNHLLDILSEDYFGVLVEPDGH